MRHNEMRCATCGLTNTRYLVAGPDDGSIMCRSVLMCHRRTHARLPVALILKQRIIKQQTDDGCWLWTGPVNNQGYGRLRGRYAHRMAYELANGSSSLSSTQVIRHACDQRRCVRPDHLLPGTQRDNMRDVADRDRHPRYHPKAIREEAVRRVVRDGESQASVARALGIPYGTVTALVWKSRHAG